MITLTPDETRSAGAEPSKIIVLYENGSVRERAARFCERMRHRSEPDVHWCSFASLQDPRLSAAAGQEALRAGVIVLASTRAGDLPGWVKSWLQQWLGKRGRREGALVGLLDSAGEDRHFVSLKEMFLRQIAHQAEMDYLSHAPPTQARAIPDSLDSYNRRAGKMTAVLDQILHTHPPQRPLV